VVEVAAVFDAYDRATEPNDIGREATFGVEKEANCK
jgi:hypothetical protein